MKAWTPALTLALATAAASAAAAPSAKQIAKLVAPQRTPHDRFGTAVAADAGRAVVGSVLADIGIFTEAGRTHALVRAAGEWKYDVDLESVQGAYYNRNLGASAAIAGDFAVLGALENWVAGKGSLYAYTYVDPTGWALEANVPAPGASDEDFGAALAVTPGHVLASPQFPPGFAGLTYAWARLGPAQWTPLPPITPDDTAPGDSFGLALSLHADEVLIGAPGADEGRGAAYVFAWTGTLWMQTAKLVASDRQPGDIFGASLALGPDVALIGAPGRDGATGRVLTFQRLGPDWIQDPEPLSSDLPEPGSVFGRGIALEGRHAVVTAHDQGIDVNMPGLGGRGRATWYGQRDDGTWVELAVIEADDGIPGDRLGYSVALDGGDALLGAPGDDENLGAVYVFQLSQAEGDPCVEGDDCDAALCCDGVCTPPEICAPASTGDPTDTSSDPTGTTTTGASTESPMLDIDPLQPTGCACVTSTAPWRGAWLVVLALGLRRPRRPRGALP